MITVRKAEARGSTNLGWLDSKHTFSFGRYLDPEHMGFRTLRVINDDRVAPGGGFDTHPHRDMEILSYVLDGALEHKDSSGGGGVLRPGDVQRMSAGSGVLHSEFNASKSEPVHFLQVWIEPKVKGATPAYGQKNFPIEERRDALRLIASPDSAEGSLSLEQDARIYASVLSPGKGVTHALGAGRHAWMHLARGKASVNGQPLSAGDGAAITGTPSIEIAAEGEDAELLLFDLA